VENVVKCRYWLGARRSNQITNTPECEAFCLFDFFVCGAVCGVKSFLLACVGFCATPAPVKTPGNTVLPL
jgi:hypothetical protein